MPLGGALALGAGSLASGIIGNMSSSGDREAAMAQRQKALQEYLAINVPDPAKQQLILEKYQMTGQLDPAIETAINEGATAQDGIAVDPTTRAAQMSALSKLSDITANNGMDAQEKQQIQQGINSVNTNEQGQRGAILQDAAARGVGGSGASLAAQLLASQAGANRASDNAMGAQAQASQRALQALSQQGNMAGSIHSQDYNQALNRANAQDAINQFNARNQNSAMAANTQAKNQAQIYNVQEAQNVANQNTGISNYQQQYNSGLQQQQFNNQMNLASGRANAENGVASQDMYNAQQKSNMWGGISGALGTAAGAVYKNGSKSGNNSNSNTTTSDNYDPNANYIGPFAGDNPYTT